MTCAAVRLPAQLEEQRRQEEETAAALAAAEAQAAALREEEAQQQRVAAEYEVAVPEEVAGHVGQVGGLCWLEAACWVLLQCCCCRCRGTGGQVMCDHVMLLVVHARWRCLLQQ